LPASRQRFKGNARLSALEVRGSMPALHNLGDEGLDVEFLAPVEELL
jgi:hypothetical protein